MFSNYRVMTSIVKRLRPSVGTQSPPTNCGDLKAGDIIIVDDHRAIFIIRRVTFHNNGKFVDIAYTDGAGRSCVERVFSEGGFNTNLIYISRVRLVEMWRRERAIKVIRRLIPYDRVLQKLWKPGGRMCQRGYRNIEQLLH